MSQKKPTESQQQPIKSQPTFFPFGFSVGKLDDDIVIIDFVDLVDRESGKLTVISSFALTPQKAQELARALTEKDE
ncbi:hypothetical protein [Laribacter hongkongensis]|uniref:Uncharacterized protein n=1 Tax=Laribacter hongkongensis TaxID=168471 RepID=A0ABD4SUZ3_9NEIS|nr:hypothetical protein [Laribacter hongkongensis]MCG9027071.1 hypothetical protein [Laribacter hongkongensis]